ncbi:UDP-N-acetylmuramoyl-tripeptide--D-alanyl-D-alanine ligase [Antarcticibacterium flavum]|uniref:UDP-N-acetylmuramoyl-tripeptide--D-alanyl-D-alanine ligase n=1 Tax=Antarcticibacterium flavum TaxID=2058175 RepID=A0A5B7X0W7_9FLAO|nr:MULTISPECIES: UDP-N-acetylmuramoyl-tripeptide--D-alanyl-D-alanine ligase [Antarcticibacterium]MCM4160494.1 UDP-N-acetylmuramoyl-tripeptide--D-alanyl-D-alanine ligase [Antarcticibacterium sp. W02-3]QCY69234.1 UDP-N-acetylmuramoyl-tripeptide--D-alanyl-D-alanine ligase [Antarcticibacterium flavum]
MKIDQLYQLFLESEGIATDTRSIRTNQIFFALKGDNFNGNTFAWQALKKGASYAIIDQEEFAKDDRYVIVKNVLQTLQDLATYHRTNLGLPLLAITGSNGKTTSKELIYAVLRKKFETIATPGNLNNHIGVPLTLLSLKPTTEFGIIEMGANHHGEIQRLCEIALPDYGYITNFGKAHLEGFGSLEGVVTAKSELYDHIKTHGKHLFLNADDKVQKKHLNYSPNYSFGENPAANVKVSYEMHRETAAVKSEGENYQSSLTGSYNAVNIAAAICIGKYFEIPEENIRKAILDYSPKNNRSQIIKAGDNTLLMDAYNANPTSMKAALESFSRSKAPNKVVILGDMFELGKDAAMEHQEIVNYLEKSNFSTILLTGENFSQTNTDEKKIRRFRNFEELKRALEENIPEGAFILIKGSRGMALERVESILKNR